MFKTFFNLLLNKESRKQLIRYAEIGIAHNSIGYFIYLLVTWFGVDPKIVVAISYPLSMLISYFGNKKYTFHSNAKISTSSLKFLLAHFCSYSINLLMLYIFVDILNLPHQLIQLIAIFVCAFFLFLTLKLFVFAQTQCHTEKIHA